MIQLLVSSPSSGSGKTTVSCALLAALKTMGYKPCAFKCGPDYIDPMFHRSVLGVSSRSLDLFFSEPGTVRGFYAAGAAGHTAAVCEGAMGLYDGLGGVSDEASAWQLAAVLGLPVLLVVQPRGASLTLAAQINGLAAFRPKSGIAGIFLNNCSERMYKLLAPMLEKECGLPVLGYLPHIEQAAVASRHLGLYTAAEVADLQQKLSALAAALKNTVDWQRFINIFDIPAPAYSRVQRALPHCADIAVASDEAFCFVYSETLEALEREGARLRFFSPLRDSALPEGVGGLYLPGGYPELHARELAGNRPMLAAVRQAVLGGMPTAAECGGFMYLGRQLEAADGSLWPMAGALPGTARRVGRLVRFGYAKLAANADSMLFRAGESAPAHEFHHWDSTENGAALRAQKPVSGQSWQCGFVSESLYAGFPHLYWAGTPLPRRFVSAAQKYIANKANV